jgi:hypothetical protein
MLTLLQTWLYVAERDGVETRQRAYVEALTLAISAVNATVTVTQALALLRVQEAAVAPD